uniref:Uncharacterized protein n=1 Tax=Octactis speculum TaxID=3111310 RepID=A0A7S2BLJ5_9STRA|mmetsp:Transcript_24594/g.33695  ORF Transcript_24594/g.33695 Transcript_24594/m.33695 type:complete len:503 (+) Transcript_24594:145-1653(+)|eukprot:CAMPEP_0185751792 /NCGR_PEP_ID=MMETSP1174-20130828/10572_1 /TAXON_ID=35687 /ORGANISM="Dictyocha speculum, Strain CCMP1381" /LENGTH=502 /DNA_ID=CAMNT_0028428939 /DNA_START=125 /DNA_END=1630 /DNA_ORIENTATION=-
MHSHSFDFASSFRALLFRLVFFIFLVQGEDVFFEETDTNMVCKREDLVCDKKARKCFKTKYCRTMRFSPPRKFLRSKIEQREKDEKEKVKGADAIITGESRSELFMSDDERETRPAGNVASRIKDGDEDEVLDVYCKRVDLVCYKSKDKCYPSRFCWSMKFTPGISGPSESAEKSAPKPEPSGPLSAPRANPFDSYSKPVMDIEKPRPLSAPRASLGGERFGERVGTQMMSAPRDDMSINVAEVYCKRADLACEVGSRQCFRTKYCSTGQFEPPGQSAPDSLESMERVIYPKNSAKPAHKEVAKWGDDDDDNLSETDLPTEWMGDAHEPPTESQGQMDMTGEELKQALINALGGAYAAKAWAQLEYSGVSLGGAPGSIAVKAGPLIPSMWIAKKKGQVDGTGYAYAQISFSNSAPLSSDELSQLLKNCPTTIKNIGRVSVLNIQACDLGPEAAGPLAQFIEIGAWTPRAQLWLDANPRLRASVSAIAQIQKAADEKSINIVW